jgi:hypothetical protein
MAEAIPPIITKKDLDGYVYFLEKDRYNGLSNYTKYNVYECPARLPAIVIAFKNHVFDSFKIELTDKERLDKVLSYDKSISNYSINHYRFICENNPSGLRELLSETKFKKLKGEEKKLERDKLDYILESSMHFMRNHLAEQAMNIFSLYFPSNENGGRKALEEAFEQERMVKKVDSLVYMGNKMVKRIREVKTW